LLIFIGLIDIWLLWGGWFWSFFFKLVWLVVKLFSVIWSEAVDERTLVRESEAQDIPAQRRGKRTLVHHHRHSQTS
jgi:hypothetical protein